MRTPNFSSAASTTSTIDSESTSRSSVKLLSICTSDAGMPVTSFTMSARPARTSVSDIRGSSLMSADLRPVGYGGFAVPGCAVTCLSVCRCADRGRRSGQAVDLPGEVESGAEAEQQGQRAALDLAALEHPCQRHRDRGGRGVAGVDDVLGDHDVVAEAERP